MRLWIRSWMSLLLAGSSACQGSDVEQAVASRSETAPAVERKLAQYTPVRLTVDLSGLSERERRMIPLLIRAAQEMDTIFWQQVYPHRRPRPGG
jgi:hypothetical protein